MQISNAASSPTLTQPTRTGTVTGATPNATTSNGGTAAASTPPASLGQDAAISISPEGTTALAEDPGSTTASPTTTQTIGTTSNGTPTDTGTAGADNTDDTDSASQSSSANDAGSDARDSSAITSVSPLKSFAYGTLGLERPDQVQQETNSFYTAGRWLAAGITIGGLISLLA